MKKTIQIVVFGALLATSSMYAIDKSKHFDINAEALDAKRIKAEDLALKKEVTEKELGLRKVDLYSEEKALGDKTDYDRPAPGASVMFERAFQNAPPMIPHSVEGLLPITTNNNQCLACHMPEVASAIGATAIPKSHFTDYRPEIKYKNGKVIKEGKVWGKDWENTTDIKLAKARKSNHMNEGRFNCTQCHAPQSKTKLDVGNTFVPDFKDAKFKTNSTLADVMNEGIN